MQATRLLAWLLLYLQEFLRSEDLNHTDPNTHHYRYLRYLGLWQLLLLGHQTIHRRQNQLVHIAPTRENGIREVINSTLSFLITQFPSPKP